MTASNVGVSPEVIHEGGYRYSVQAAVKAVKAIDTALRSCPKYLQKRIKAQRMSFVFAFGPEMEEECGPAPALR